MAFAGVLGDSLSVDEDDLEVLLIDPYLSLEVMLVLLDGPGTGLEDVGVEFVDLLAAEVLDVVLGKIVGGEDEGQAVLNVVKVGGGHHDRGGAGIETARWCEDDVLFALALAIEGDVGDLLILTVDLPGIVVDRVDFDRLAEGIVLAGLGEFGFACGEPGNDLLGGGAGRR